MQQLSGLDASFLYFETPQHPTHIGSFSIYDPSTAPGGEVSFDDILENTRRRLHLARCFRQKVVRVPFDLDHPYWVEDADFDLEYHVRHIALPKPGNWQQLCQQAARIHSRILDLTRPLWEVYMIEGLDGIEGLPEGSFAFLMKIHHAAIDGVSGAELTAALHDDQPDASPPEPEREWEPERDPEAFELLTRTYWNNLQNPFRFAQVWAETIPAFARLNRQLRSRRYEPTGAVPRTRFNKVVSAHRVVDGRTFDLGEIREIRKTVAGATVNDAVLTICGGALRRYLEAKGELPAESLLAMAPISVRSDAERSTAGNRVAGMTVTVRSDIADPVERLQAVFEGTSQSKELTKAVGAELMTDYSQFIPGSLAALATRVYTQMGMANQMNPVVNTVITNVPGPQVPLYMTGARLVETIGLGPVMDGVGLIHPVFSYCGKITIAATACREMMPDPAFYADCLQASFEELREATLGPRA